MTIRDRHLFRLASYVLANTDTWTLPADWGLRVPTTSAEEVLAIIGYPQPSEGEDYSEEAREYAKHLWLELGPYLNGMATTAS